MTEILHEGFDELEAHGYRSDYIEMKHFTDGRPSICRPAFDLENCMEVGAPRGTRMVFSNKNGYDIEREQANALIGENSPVTVHVCSVGRSSSTYEFVEFPNKKFNTVMFEKYQNIQKED